MIDMGLIEDENLIYGVEPQKVICEGQYTISITHLEEPITTCSFTIPFNIEFWNVGALGGAEFAGASFTWSYVDFYWAECEAYQMTEKTSSGEFSGGPNGLASITWASIQLISGQMGSLSYSDEDETMTGTCTILSPAAFAGWTGP